MFRNYAALLLVLFVSNTVRAEGLIYQLPPDGHWASYTINQTLVESDGEETTVTGKLTLSSVGNEVVDGKSCRWIEISILYDLGIGTTHTVDKLLIPEESFQNGKDPLKQVYKFHRRNGKDDVTIELKIVTC